MWRSRGAAVRRGRGRARFLTATQRHLGLYLSCLAPLYHTLAAGGELVTQHQLLGDAALNAGHHSHRHNAVLNATYNALSHT